MIVCPTVFAYFTSAYYTSASGIVIVLTSPHFPIPPPSHARFLGQDILDRQTQRGEDVGYCLATRVRNQVYHEAAKDLGCYGAGNQCKAGKCMSAALGVFAGKGKAAVPTETVRALCKY